MIVEIRFVQGYGIDVKGMYHILSWVELLGME